MRLSKVCRGGQLRSTHSCAAWPWAAQTLEENLPVSCRSYNCVSLVSLVEDSVQPTVTNSSNRNTLTVTEPGRKSQDYKKDLHRGLTSRPRRQPMDLGPCDTSPKTVNFDVSYNCTTPQQDNTTQDQSFSALAIPHVVVPF